MILVVGATGGVGKRVVKLLIDGEQQVRVLVRDLPRAQQLFKEWFGGRLPDRLEFFGGDLTIAGSLTPALMTRVTAVICCSGTKVQPVEGDTPQREKYYQGLKFYLPEVVDVPEQVEYEGIKNLLAVLQDHIQPKESALIDFRQTDSPRLAWYSVDDGVMGGVSASQWRLTSDRALFTGEVSTANNGGFASVRSPNFEPALDLSHAEGIQLRIQGDGKRYKFIVRSQNEWDGLSYCYSFDTFNNRPQTVCIPFRQLIPVFRAKTVPEKGPFNPSQVSALQLMHSKFEYDGGLNPSFSPGIFGLEIESIKTYANPLTPQFIHVSSAGVTRPGRPGLNLAEEPPAVRLNEQLGGILTWKLQGEEAIRGSGLTYTIVRPCALTESENPEMLQFAQGDNLRGQVSRWAIAKLCVDSLQLAEAGGKTFEVNASEPGSNQAVWPFLLRQLNFDQR
ncbi:CIA30 family protein [Synechocystis sp. PCC 7339]|uniref:CIA30 family protein n=1 Tax=unclassified Synechocystis TaxID=2640012 RepID=UPI001BAF779C|nr:MULTISPECIES: CIA30 family protein [unclassified Synechocystis]QUS61315.1 CIA30 family protein [Synechocystis sp. PCC 7338]UAJ73501.1 CIA30 family protein [Synechocystis sp. PCC 7339]